MLFYDGINDPNKTIVLLQPDSNLKATVAECESQLNARSRFAIMNKVVKMMSPLLVANATWRCGQDNFIELQWILKYHLQPAWKKWYCKFKKNQSSE